MNEHIHRTTVPHANKEKAARSDVSKMGAVEFLWMSGSAVVMGMGIYLLPLLAL